MGLVGVRLGLRYASGLGPAKPGAGRWSGSVLGRSETPVPEWVGGPAGYTGRRWIPPPRWRFSSRSPILLG